MAFLRIPLILLSLLVLANCASLTKGTDQTVTVITEPAGATCDLKRDGATIAVVNPTPGSVTVSKSKDHISVLCEKAEHEDGAGTLSSEFQAMTFGNILFGGLIGVGIDAASGAMNEYPPSITVVLPPESFPSIAARNAFYEKVKARVSSQAAEAIAEVEQHCASNAADRCAVRIKAIEEARDAELETLKAKQMGALVSAQ